MRSVRQLLPAGRRGVAPPPHGHHSGVTDQGFDFNLDVCNADCIVGWAVHPSGVTGVEVRLQDRSIGQVKFGVPRADVAAVKHDVTHALHSGLQVAFPEGTFPTGEPQQLVIEFTARDGSTMQVERQVWPVGIPGGDPVRPGLAPSSIPADVVAALAALQPGVYHPEAQWDPELIERSVHDIVQILQRGASVKPVLRYAHFLLSMSGTFGFIDSHFDRINRLVDASAKDFEAVASSPQEMLCIANHLYVLRSRGSSSGLIECGCFKGFSTCCLSQACAWLGMPLHVFDSFEGLPPSEGDYYQTGDFRGTMDEVTDNLQTFGQPSVVQLHRGFFSDTLPHFADAFSCIWMDVDLEASAKDVMMLLPELPVDSCVFSHECPPETFSGSQPQPDASEVLPPIIDAYRALDMNPAGRHLGGFLGAIWADKSAAPVLGSAEIAAIVAAAKS